MRNELYADILANSKRNSPISFASTIIFSSGFHLIFAYRLSKYLLKFGYFGKTLSKIVFKMYSEHFGCYISPLSHISGGLRLPHPVGIVIGEGSIIDSSVSIYQNCTIGQKSANQGYPRLEKNVTLYSGCIVFGNISIGKNTLIGAGSIVNVTMPADSVCYGNPCVNIKKKS